MRAAFAAAAALFGTGCAQSAVPPDDRETVEIFDGELVALNGQSVRGSNIKIRLVAAGDDREVANHYFLRGGCRDHGFLDKADGRFWSGSTPEKNGEMGEFMRKRDRSVHCLAEDVSRYHEIVALMEEGAALQLAPNRSTAKFTTPSNKTIEFEHSTALLID